MKEFKQLGAYGIVIKDEKILLIKKHGGPYDGKLDLPGGTIEFGERPEVALKRELEEEVGIKVNDYSLFDADSVNFEWLYEKENLLINVHHVGIFYKVLNYNGDIQQNVEITEQNDDSEGADFYNIKSLEKENLSQIALLELEKLGYIIK